ncbi:MAG: contact-dependent growth inhibition system immunity protein [Thermoanaerobaculia bacterium]
MMTDYPQLHQFFGAYFHQDWMLDDATVEEVIERFISENPRSAIVETQHELDRLLGAVEDDAALASAVAAMGCEYYPPGDDRTYRDWLTAVASRLRRDSPEQPH